MGTAEMRKKRSSRNILPATASADPCWSRPESARPLRRLRAAHAVEALFLQHAQQLRLNGQRQLADFIEKNRPAVRQFHFADFARARARVGAALVAE